MSYPSTDGPSVKDCSCGERGGVVDTNDVPAGRRRRYECPGCHRKWSTLETPAARIGKTRLTRTESEAEERRRVAFELNRVITAALEEWVQHPPA